MDTQPSDLATLMDYAGKYKYLTYASWILSSASAVLALLPFIFIWLLLKEVLETAPDFSAAQNLAFNGWMAVLFSVLAILVYVGALLCSHIAAFRVQAEIRSRTTHHILSLPMGTIETIGSGKLRKIIYESSEATETYLAHRLPDKCGAVITPIALLCMLLFFDWRLGLVSLLPVGAGFAIMGFMTGPRMAERMKQYQNALEQMSNEAVEYIRGIPVIKTFGQSIFSFKRFRSSIENYEKWVIAYTKELRLPMLIYTTAINAIFAVLIAAALIFTSSGVTTEFMLSLMFYIIITPIITITLNKIMYASEDKMIVSDALTRINEILNIHPLSEPEIPRHPADNSVTLNNITFRYPNAEENALTTISLNIKPGEHIALVGPSGSGKTTLGRLIARFHDPDTGTVTIGGTDVRNIPKEQLMQTVSFVFQDSILLKTSILENVRMAKPDASRHEIEQALKTAQCEDILEKFPKGIDTILGTKGVYLSGGEQQRIAIARAILKNAPVLILDEATAFADPENEQKVRAAFAALSIGKTVIMIAHRLSTVTNADNIYVIKDGSICESGKHSTLINTGGMYAGMWQEYTRSITWNIGSAA